MRLAKPAYYLTEIRSGLDQREMRQAQTSARRGIGRLRPYRLVVQDAAIIDGGGARPAGALESVERTIRIGQRVTLSPAFDAGADG